MTTSVTSKFFLNKDSFYKKVRRYNKTRGKKNIQKGTKKLRQLAEFYNRSGSWGIRTPGTVTRTAV